MRNDVRYQYRRRLGEDLCEVLLQAEYADNTLGPVLHVVCKQNGALWIERKMNPREFVNPWQPIEGTAIRYAATIDGPDSRHRACDPLGRHHRRSAARPTGARPFQLHATQGTHR